MKTKTPDPQANEHDQRAAMVEALIRIAEASERTAAAVEKLLQERRS